MSGNGGSPFELAAIINKKQAEAFRDDAYEWKDLALKLKAKGIEIAAAAHAQQDLCNEMVLELDGKKPRRLSDPANRAGRLEFIKERKRLSQQQLIKNDVNPLLINTG